jgi:CBS domain-containing protein
MLDRPVKSLVQPKKLLLAPGEATVRQAAQRMAKANAGAVLVVKEERLVGIFTERDLVFRVVAKGLDPESTPLADVMTRDPRTIAPDRPFGQALLVMHENGFRHLPVVEDGKPIGIVSARSAMDPDLEEFVSEASRREYFRNQS